MLRMPPCSGACESAVGDREAEQVVEQLVEVLRPADGDRGRRTRRTPAAGRRRRPSRRPRRASRRRRSTTSRTPARRWRARRSRWPSGRRPRRRSRTTRSPPGPPTGTACVRTMKMPVPIVAPTPNSVSWNSPMVRGSSPPSAVGARSRRSSRVTGLRRRTCSRRDEAVPPGRLAMPRPSLSSTVDVRARAGRPRSRAAPPASAAPSPAKTTGMRRLPL